MRYWIGVASKAHVALGVAGGFCQLCHGKARPLERMSRGDWIVYYSPTEVFRECTPCQQFTAIGEIMDTQVYSYEMAPGFTPFRRDVRFVPAQSTPIRPLLDQLTFIRNPARWGMAFRFGHLEIPQVDFERIATHMGADLRGTFPRTGTVNDL